MSEIISQNHINAIKFIIPIFQENQITYRITGGFAGNLYGSQWKTHDIDIEVARVDIPKILELFRDYLVIDLMRLVDDEFDLLLMTLTIYGIDIEINQAEEAFVINNGKSIRLDSDLFVFNTIEFHDLQLRVKPLEQIIAYKKLIGREKDLAELTKLTTRK